MKLKKGVIFVLIAISVFIASILDANFSNGTNIFLNLTLMLIALITGATQQTKIIGYYKAYEGNDKDKFKSTCIKTSALLWVMCGVVIFMNSGVIHYIFN